MMVPVAVLGLLAGACSSTKEVRATAPAGATSMQASTSARPVPNTPTAANVRISDEVLRACNIPDADAHFAFDSSRLTAFDGTYLGDQGLGRSAMTTTSRGAMDATGTDETGWAHDRRVDVLLAN